MNKLRVDKIIIITFTLFIHTRPRVLSKQNKQSQIDSTILCTMPLISSYVNGANLTEVRHSQESTPKQRITCPTLSSSCCTESEMERLTSEFNHNTSTSYHFNRYHIRSIQIIQKMSLNQIEEIFANIKSFSFHKVVDTDKLEAEIKEIHFHPKRFVKTSTDAFRFLNRNASGFLCAVCYPPNHGQVSKSSLTLNVNQCLKILQDEGFKKYTQYVKDIVTLHRFVSVIDLKFDAQISLKVPLPDLDEYYSDPDSGQCKDAGYFFENLEDCVDLCKDLGMLNINGLNQFSTLISANLVLLRDYVSGDGYFDYLKGFLAKEKYYEVKNNHVWYLLLKEEKQKRKKKIYKKIKKRINSGSIYYMLKLTPKAELDLSFIDLNLVTNGGWNDFALETPEIEFSYVIEEFSMVFSVWSWLILF